MKTFLILILLAVTTPAHAQLIDDLRAIGMTEPQLHAACAASNALVASQSSGVFAEVLYSEARRHRELSGPAAPLIETVMKGLQNEYNNGGISWKELVELSRACSSL